MNKKLFPVMLCFFAMGFVDLVGIASNYVKEDLHLSDAMANMLPSLVFLWFLIFSLPTSLLMNRIGRRNTVLVSLAMTLAALVVPVFTLNFAALLVSFSLLGIGNAIMQTSLNPLVDSVMKGGASASTLTFGQFIKSIASFLAPVIASWGAAGNVAGLGWRVLYPIYLAVGVLTTLLLFSTRISEPVQVNVQRKSIATQFADCFRLLANPMVLLCFIAIVCHVGIDVGTSVTAPKILIERLGMALNDAAISATIYFIAKAAGSFSGSFVMKFMSDWLFFFFSVAMMTASLLLLCTAQSQWVLYLAIALMGFGNGNPFSIVFSRALAAVPGQKNEVSGLLIMGLFGGTVFPLAMGLMSDAFGQIGAVSVMALGVLYMLAFWFVGRKG